MRSKGLPHRFRPRDWPIGVKLLFGFGLMALVTLGLAAVNLYSFVSVQRTVDKAINEGLRIQSLSTQIQNDLAAARQQEQSFLLRWQEEGYQQAANTYLIPFGGHISHIHRQIDELEDLIVGQPNIPAQAQEAPQQLAIAVDAYRDEFGQVTALLHDRGDRDSGVIGELEDAASDLERAVSRLEQTELSNAFLQLRASEMRYRLDGDPVARSQTRIALAQLRAMINWLLPDQAEQFDPLLTRYEQAFDELIAIDAAIAQHIAAYTDAVNTVRFLVLEIAAAGTALADADLSRITAGVQQASRLALLAIGLSVILSAFLAWLFTRQIGQPIQSLAESAHQIERGNLAVHAPVRSRDEIGTLAQAFNSMAVQLRDLIAGLEQRVADRTRALEKRAALLATAADVGHTVTSILELESLTRRVVELIRERFDLYYAGLFLIDETSVGPEDDEYAVLVAGTGEAGQRLKEQGHKLRVGGASMVGAACAHKEPRLALDVADPSSSAEIVRFDNPLLPETRSEMALPLIVGERVLGALDVQSTKPAAFSQEDIAVLQLVANQIAVAVDNALKFSEEATLLEATSPLYRISRRLTTATTTNEVVQAIIEAVADTEADGCMIARFDRTGRDTDQIQTVTFLGHWRRHSEFQIPIGQPLPPENINLQALTTFWITEDVEQDTHFSDSFRRFLLQREVRSLVNIPLRIGTRFIGFIAIFRSVPGPFPLVALRLYETLADQAAVALERGRLLEEAQRQAEREHAIRDLADRVTASFDIDTILQTTLEDLSAVVGAEGGYIELSMGEEETR